MLTDLDPDAAREQVPAEHDRLRGMLAGRDPADLDRRPDNGKWSVFENLRHLVFAEQVQLGRFVRADAELQVPLNPTTRETRLRMTVKTAATADELVDAIAAFHAAFCAAIDREDPKVRRALNINLSHLRIHIEAIEVQLRRLGKSVSRGQGKKEPAGRQGRAARTSAVAPGQQKGRSTAPAVD